ncbi:MAG: sulfite exporter TauE/SafE family protein [Candidatus Aceula meridiana]|nr:sulfite exporter TauE/SafE family protein [Candidatus Aceula meridiana]
MLILFLCIFLTAFIFSMFGLGGGLFYMPLFLLFFSSPQEASCLSFLCIIVTAATSAAVYVRKRVLDLRLLGFLGVPLIVGVFLSGFWVYRAHNNIIFLILSIILVCAGFLMAFLPKKKFLPSKALERIKERFPDKEYCFHPAVLSPVMAFIGFLCGVSGVAGGVFEVPMMIMILGVPVRRAIGTSAVIVFCSGLLGMAGRLTGGCLLFSFLPSFLFKIVLLALAGAFLGPMVSLKVHQGKFKRICGVIIFVIGLIYFVRIF